MSDLAADAVLGDKAQSKPQRKTNTACRDQRDSILQVVGTLDLIAAIALATIHEVAPFMGPAYWIPAFWVPTLLVTHYVTFVFLGKRWAKVA